MITVLLSTQLSNNTQVKYADTYKVLESVPCGFFAGIGYGLVKSLESTVPEEGVQLCVCVYACCVCVSQCCKTRCMYTFILYTKQPIESESSLTSFLLTPAAIPIEISAKIRRARITAYCIRGEL